MSQSDVAISIRGLSKSYTIAHGGLKRPSFRELVMDRLRHPFHKPQLETFWALKDVSFDVKKGDVVGIIGRNGAGKSTLLKILSRITEPTEGEVHLRGRVGSLLEVGTGFHPELTGRENIYLNGAILGMSRDEIRRQFDAIVDFSGVEKFLDTPVKRYSSGMYVRLAFAVAAHLNPQILIVDEVLAVGDAEFQKKCLGKMKDVASGGRTVLFVSHNMAAVQALCDRALLVQGGVLAKQGRTEEVVHEYINHGFTLAATPLADRVDRGGDGSVRIQSITIADAAGGQVTSGSRLRVDINYTSERPICGARFLAVVYDLANRGIFRLDSEMAGGLPRMLPPKGTVRSISDPINLTAGPCTVNVAVHVAGVLADHVKQAASFDVEPQDLYGTGKLPDRNAVLCILPHRWSMVTDGPPCFTSPSQAGSYA